MTFKQAIAQGFWNIIAKDYPYEIPGRYQGTFGVRYQADVHQTAVGRLFKLKRDA